MNRGAIHLNCPDIYVGEQGKNLKIGGFIGVNLSNYREEDVKLPLLFSRRAQIGDAFREPIRGGYARYILSTTPAAFSRPVGIHSAVPSLE
jgi:hypothetical protein